MSINGRLEKGGDVDSYAVWLEAGQTAVAEVDAYVLASPLDAVLRVVDDQGRQLALNHDDGRTLRIRFWPLRPPPLAFMSSRYSVFPIRPRRMSVSPATPVAFIGCICSKGRMRAMPCRWAWGVDKKAR